MNRLDMSSKFEKADVRMGEIQSNVFEPTADAEKHIRPVIYWDARIREVDQPFRSTTEWFIDADCISDAVGEYDEWKRKFMWLLAWMSNAPNTMRDGYRISYRALTPEVEGVHYFLNSLGEMNMVVPGEPKPVKPVPGSSQVNAETKQEDSPLPPVKTDSHDAVVVTREGTPVVSTSPPPSSQ